MKTIIELIIKNSDWLYVKLFENPIFFFDFWSFAHFWSGGVLITIISKTKFKRKWIILFSLLLLYEIIEILLPYLALNVFLPETIKDQFTDIFVGMAGGYVVDKWLNFYSSSKKQYTGFFQNPKTHIALFSALTIAFIWVGFYKYEYNAPILNSPGLNYTAFSLWSAALFVMLCLYNLISVRFKKTYSVALLWIIYFTGLCIFEFTFYHIFGIKESGKHDHKPLIFDIIHGSTVLHIFYLSVPVISVGLYSLLNRFFYNTFNFKRNLNDNLYLTENYDKIEENEISYKPVPIASKED